MKRTRPKLGRLGDLLPARDRSGNAEVVAKEHDEIAIGQEVGERRTTAAPAPIHEVLGSNDRPEKA